MGPTTDETVSEMDEDPTAYYSNWWYGVAIPALMELAGWGLIGVVRAAGLLEEGRSGLLLLVPLITLLMVVILSPIFALSLFLDARKLKKKARSWNPNPYFWGGVGLIPLVSIFSISYSFIIPIAIVYLYLRNKHVGTV